MWLVFYYYQLRKTKALKYYAYFIQVFYTCLNPKKRLGHSHRTVNAVEQ